MTHERNTMTQPREIDLYIRSDRRTAIAHSGPYKGTRFIRVGGTHWMLAGTASPAEQEEAAKHATASHLQRDLADLLNGQIPESMRGAA